MRHGGRDECCFGLLDPRKNADTGAEIAQTQAAERTSSTLRSGRAVGGESMMELNGSCTAARSLDNLVVDRAENKPFLPQTLLEPRLVGGAGLGSHGAAATAFGVC